MDNIEIQKEVHECIKKEVDSWKDENNTEVNIFFLEKLQGEDKLNSEQVEELIDIIIVLHTAIINI